MAASAPRILETVAVTLLALAGTLILLLGGIGSPVAAVHLAFAAGILPLIFAAMIHFVPVLTRSGDPEARIAHLPRLAQINGLAVYPVLQGLLPYGLLPLLATVDLILAAILLTWIVRRSRAALGGAHPGARWYVAALACLLAALMAVLALSMVPATYGPARLIHLHLNTLGLVGLAALGTLPLLVPTALGQGDPQAAPWLRRQLPLAGGSVALVALGSALAWPLAVAGGLLLGALVVGLLRHWRQRFGWPVLWRDGVTVSLLAATGGLVLALLSGFGHVAGGGRLSLAVWGAGFLLPLVTGALTQLLPVWRWPGPTRPERLAMRTQLAAGGRWRALAFFAAGLTLAAGGMAGQASAAAWMGVGGVFIALGMARFAVDLARAVRLPRSTR